MNTSSELTSTGRSSTGKENVTSVPEASTSDQHEETDSPVEDATSESQEFESELDDLVGEWSSELPADVVFDLLKNQRRRLILQYLHETEGSTTIGTLAEQIAAFENGVSPTALNAQQRKRVYIGLYQCHLPKMADAGVLDVDQNRGVVAMNERGERLLEFIDANDDVRRSPRPLLGLVAGGGLLYTVAHVYLPGWTAPVVVFAVLAAIAAFSLLESARE